MKKYFISMMSGKIYEVSPKTTQGLIGKKGLQFITELDCAINISSIEVIENEEKFKANQRRTAKEFRLRDGTKVVKKFGSWVDPSNPNLIIDPSYYPEIAKDEVMTEWEWQEKQKTKQLGEGGSKDL